MILDQIKGYRMEQDVNTELLKNTIRAIFINTGYETNVKIAKDSVTKEIKVSGDKTMKSYENDFEKNMLEETKKFYRGKSAEWRNQSASYFIEQSLKFLAKEEDMADRMFEKSTKPKVLQIFYNHVLIVNAQGVINQK